jgi:hypothetical protein
MKRTLKWLGKWAKRALLALLGVVVLFYLFVLARSLMPVNVEDDDLQIETLAEPLDPPPTPSNAFDVLEVASRKLWWPQDLNQRFRNELLSPTSWNAELADEVLQKNQPALAALAEADKFPNLMVPGCAMEEKLTYLEDWKKLSLLLGIQEKSRLEKGQVKESFDGMLKHLQLCQQMADAHGPSIVYLVGCATASQTLDHFRQSLATTNLAQAQLQECVAELGRMATNSGPVFANMIKAEYQSQVQSLDNLREGRIPDVESGTYYPKFRWWFPVFNHGQTKSLFADYSRALIANSTNHLNTLKLPELPFSLDYVPLALSGNFAGRVMCFRLRPMESALFHKKVGILVQVQATRTLMALRAYQLTHGKLPQDLSALVPEFLDQIPFDDFNGQPLHYSAEKKIVYSVGNNLKDDGGDDRGEEEWNTAQRHLDIVFHFDF